MVHTNHSGETKCEGLMREALTAARIPFEQEAEISGYHVDFLVSGRICIEVDGFSHLSSLIKDRDSSKEKHLADLGYTVMRIQDSDARIPRLLKTFVASVKEQMAAEKKAAGKSGDFKPKPFGTPELSALREKLAEQEIRKSKEPPDDGELFRSWVERIGPGPIKGGKKR